VRLILASASPRRAELLRAAGFEFSIRAVDVDERTRAGEPPDVYVRRLAAEKSFAAAGGPAKDSGPIILAADTAVVVDGMILGKPTDDQDAERMLRLLAGRRHEVMTGVSLRRGAYEIGRVVKTTVEFAPLSETDVAWYIASGEGRDKAGGYAIQGLAGRFVRGILGSYSNVVGLPIAIVHELLSDIASGM
jgi:septum formation protein